MIRVTLRRLLFGAWAAVVATGCRSSSKGVAIPASGPKWQFSRSEKTLFSYGGGDVSSWDISGRRVVWDKIFGSKAGLVLSGSGEHVGVIGVNSVDNARFSLLGTSTGELVSLIPLAHWPHSRIDDTTMVALSHDASWVAFGMPHPDDARPRPRDALCLAPLPGGKCVWFTDPDNAVGSLAFDPRALRIAVGWRVPPYRLDLYDHAGDTWKRVQRWEGAVCPSWTARGLTFVEPDGLHIIEGEKDVLAVRGAFIGEKWRECESFTVSPDGAWMLTWAAWELKVASTTTGATVLHHAWKKAPSIGMTSSGFSGTRFRAFTATGLLLEFNLATGALVKSTDYGLTTGTSKGWSFHEGATEYEVYTPVLSPSGDWLLIHKSQGGTTLTRL